MNGAPASADTGTVRARFREGLLVALPIVLGYLPIAFSFGIAATSAGLTPVEATVFSLVVYAGASQFLGLALLTGGAPLVVAGFTLAAMNLRHLLYGPALMRAAGSHARRRHAWAWAFGLTDEVFGASLGRLARGERFSEAGMFGLALPAWAAWVAGTAAGALAGSGALRGWPLVEAALGFMLPALFISLLLSIASRAALPAMVVAAVVTIGVGTAVSGAAGILAGMLAGAAAGMLRR